MGFYKTTLIVAIVHLILFLAILGSIMLYNKTEKLYPSELPTCPDFYTFDGSYCNANSSIYSFPTGNNCSNILMNSAEFSVPGTNENSGLCSKKTIATDCKISWDGITNNSSICEPDKK